MQNKAFRQTDKIPSSDVLIKYEEELTIQLDISGLFKKTSFGEGCYLLTTITSPHKLVRAQLMQHELNIYNIYLDHLGPLDQSLMTSG